jgi:hypothetical protein
MDPTDLYGDRYLREMRVRDFVKEAEHDRLAAQASKALPAKNGGFPASVSGTLSRGPAAVRDAVQAFWASTFRPPQEQCC